MAGRLADALRAASAPRWPDPGHGGGAAVLRLPGGLVWSSGAGPHPAAVPVAGGTSAGTSDLGVAGVDQMVEDLFNAEGPSLVRLARLFVDDRNAAEDLVQEAFIRLARAAHRVADRGKAPAYLRSIVLNLARDHNRRGLVSLRHHLPFDDVRASTEDTIELREDQRQVIDALRQLSYRQRDCLVLRYYDELGVDDIATTLGISRNSVKTHLQRGMAAMEALLAPEPATELAAPPAMAGAADTPGLAQ